jgi:nuclear transport factor 2 (NTF2) superfamily protein
MRERRASINDAPISFDERHHFLKRKGCRKVCHPPAAKTAALSSAMVIAQGTL